jgi:3-oxoacyl-[acyl-carrier-protein] synthase II
VVVVGAEAYSRVALGCFNRMGALDPVACRPFAGTRAGTVFGEGAAALVLERSADARQRGAVVHAEIVGSAFSCDAGHPTAPDPEGRQAERILGAALDTAGLQPEDVAAIIPHGTGTVLNDATEAKVLRHIWRSDRPAVPLYNLKALIGHTGGAAGALASVAAVQIIRHSTLPGNVDVGLIDEGLSLTVELEERPAVGPVVVNAYAFGGNNATLVFARRA